MPAPFINKKFTFTNPDGSTIEVVGSGNQYYARFETEDGFTAVKDPDTGYFTYAQLSDDNSQLLPISHQVLPPPSPISGSDGPGQTNIPPPPEAGLLVPKAGGLETEAIVSPPPNPPKRQVRSSKKSAKS